MGQCAISGTEPSSVTLSSRKYVRECIPPIPHFYIGKLGYAGVYLFFLFLLQNIDGEYSLEPLGEAVLKRVPTIYVLSKNKKNNKKFLLKIFNFYSLQNLCILHGQVFVMYKTGDDSLVHVNMLQFQNFTQRMSKSKTRMS